MDGDSGARQGQVNWGGAPGIGVIVSIAAAAIGFRVYSLPPTPVNGDTPFVRHVSPKLVPELHFEDGNGRSRSLADFHGKLVLLNIWATWCAPCREEMPALDRLQAELGGPEFEVLALSIDQQGVEQVRKFFAETGVKRLRIYIDPSARAGFTLGVLGIPTTLLIDPEGREIGRHSGVAKWGAPASVADLRRRIGEGRAR